MAKIGDKTAQNFSNISDQDIDLVFDSTELDETTPKDVSGFTGAVTFLAISKTDPSYTITKTSAAGQIEFGVPVVTKLTVHIENTDIPAGAVFKWSLTGVDAAADNEFATSAGEWVVVKWP